jgi:hypothetical protein
MSSAFVSYGPDHGRTALELGQLFNALWLVRSSQRDELQALTTMLQTYRDPVHQYANHLYSIVNLILRCLCIPLAPGDVWWSAPSISFGPMLSWQPNNSTPTSNSCEYQRQPPCQPRKHQAVYSSSCRHTALAQRSDPPDRRPSSHQRSNH